MNITSLILSPDLTIYVKLGYGAQLCYVNVYKLQYICSGAQPVLFYGRGGFSKKKGQYMQGIIATLYL